MENKKYWNNKIIEWEDSMAEKNNLSFIEKLASYFRKPLKIRARMCMNILKSFVKNKTILELGCGSGFFSFELYEKCKPKSIISIDISNQAIKRAKSISKHKKLENKIKFMVGDINSIKLPEAEIIIGLGFLDYLSPKEMRKLFKDIQGKQFLFTFSENKFSLLRFIHILYLKSQRCTKHFYYTKKEIVDFIGKENGNIKFVNDKKMSFGCIVHNLLVDE